MAGTNLAPPPEPDGDGFSGRGLRAGVAGLGRPAGARLHLLHLGQSFVGAVISFVGAVIDEGLVSPPRQQVYVDLSVAA